MGKFCLIDLIIYILIHFIEFVNNFFYFFSKKQGFHKILALPTKEKRFFRNFFRKELKKQLFTPSVCCDIIGLYSILQLLIFTKENDYEKDFCYAAFTLDGAELG